MHYHLRGDVYGSFFWTINLKFWKTQFTRGLFLDIDGRFLLGWQDLLIPDLSMILEGGL